MMLPAASWETEKLENWEAGKRANFGHKTNGQNRKAFA